MTETTKESKLKNKAPTQPKKVERQSLLNSFDKGLENKCFYNCECKQCKRCSICDYTVKGLRRFHQRGDKLLCENCLWDQLEKEKKEAESKKCAFCHFWPSQKQWETQIVWKVVNYCSYLCKRADLCLANDKQKEQWRKAARNSWKEYEEREKQLITLKGYTTSQINQALKADNPYPARVFLKVDNQEQDIPVFFRIKEGDEWIRPKIKTGSYLQVEGYFSNSEKERKSFTATSYQLLACPHSQKKPYYCSVSCPCLKGKGVLNQELTQQIENHDSN